MINRMRDMIAYFPVLNECVQNGQLSSVECNVQQAERLNHFINHMNMGDGARFAATAVLHLGRFDILHQEEETYTKRGKEYRRMKTTIVPFSFHDYFRLDRRNRTGYMRLLQDYMGIGAL